MARHKRNVDDFILGDDEDVPDPVRAPGRAAAAAGAPAAPPLAEPRPPRWRVALDCSTPIAYRALVVEAPDEDAAKRAFNAANGISGSSGTYAVTPLLDGEAAPEPGPEEEGPLSSRPLPGWALLLPDPGQPGDSPLVAGRLVRHGPMAGGRLEAGARFAAVRSLCYPAPDGLLVRVQDVAAGLARG